MWGYQFSYREQWLLKLRLHEKPEQRWIWVEHKCRAYVTIYPGDSSGGRAEGQLSSEGSEWDDCSKSWCSAAQISPDTQQYFCREEQHNNISCTHGPCSLLQKIDNAFHCFCSRLPTELSCNYLLMVYFDHLSIKCNTAVKKGKWNKLR